MKRISSLLAVLLLVLFIAPSVHANSEYTPRTITLSSDEVYDGDYFAAGDVVEIYGTVHGDVYAAGGQVFMDGTVDGDLLVAGGSVLISGTVTQDVRAVGGTIDISGTVNRNITVGAGDVTIGKTATLGGSLVGGAGNILVAAPVSGNIKVAAGNLTISNAVAGKVEAGVDQLRLTSEATVSDVVYWSETDASIDSTATVSGTITKKTTSIPQRNHKDPSRMNKGYLVYWMLATLVFGLVFSYLFPQQIKSATTQLSVNPWKSLGIGILVLFATPLFVLLLMVTVIGIPVSVFTLVSYALTLYLSKYIAMIFVGNWILTKYTKTTSLTKAFVIGLLIFTILKLTPFTSFVVGLVALLFGLGAIVLSSKSYMYSSKVK